MTTYSNLATVDVDATVLGPDSATAELGPLSNANVFSSEVSAEYLPKQNIWDNPLIKPVLRMVGVSALTGTSLSLMAEPVFWLDAKYLYQPPVTEPSVSERFSPIAVPTARYDPQTIVVPASQSPQFTAPSSEPFPSATSLSPDTAPAL